MLVETIIGYLFLVHRCCHGYMNAFDPSMHVMKREEKFVCHLSVEMVLPNGLG